MLGSYSRRILIRLLIHSIYRTLSWIAPEVLSKQKYTEKADIYSLAMVFYELLTRILPFAEIPSFSIPILVTKGERPHLPKDTPSKLVKLVRK